MGIPSAPQAVKFFTGIIFSPGNDLCGLKDKLINKWGGIDLESPVFSFTQTDYYEHEMGPLLSKVFFSFEKLIYPDKLAQTKQYSNRIEKDFSDRGENPARRFNIDPGYLTLSKIVLASTKDYSHRIYLGDDIYGEVTLLYQNKKFETLPWTYPDFTEPHYHKFFFEMRRIYCKQLRSSGT